MEEGKMARAMAKAGSADKLVPTPAAVPAAPATTISAPATVSPVMGSFAAHTASLQPIARVKNEWQTPASNLLMLHNGTGQFASEIRALRAKLAGNNRVRPARVIAITSGTRGEGKTTVAINLAAALSEIDTGRILLIDGDMLQPNLAQLLKVNAQTGINEVLTQGLHFDGNIYETAVPNLDLLPSQPTAPGTGCEALLHQRCGQMLAALRQHYSYIIIDTPPVLAGTQATVFGNSGDGVIVVARVERTPRLVSKRAIDELVNAGSKILGCVLTHQVHHVPNYIYRFFGTTPVHYYHYGRDERDRT